MKTKIFNSIKIITIAGILAIGASYVSAWVEPTTNPSPTNTEIAAPIHTGATQQEKKGGIWSKAYIAAPISIFKKSIFLPGNKSALRIGSNDTGTATSSFFAGSNGALAQDMNAALFGETDTIPLVIDLQRRAKPADAIEFKTDLACPIVTRFTNDKAAAFEFKKGTARANIIARQVRLTGGNPNAKDVLVGDANGNARWATATVQNGQIVFSSGTSPVPAGQCVTPSGPTPTDLCTNIAGVQETVPSGMTKDTPGDTPGVCTTPAVDQCPNIAGTQTSVPAGMIVDASGNCITPPTDLCTNIAGVQSTIPTGYEIRNDRCGIWQVLDMFPIPFQDYYGTHDAWVGYKGYNWLDSLQNISVKNSMMNYTSTPNELRAIRVPKASGYGFQPTTILETYNVGQVLYEDTRSGYRNCLINSIETSPGSNWVASEACDDGSGTGALWREFRMELFHDKF